MLAEWSYKAIREAQPLLTDKRRDALCDKLVVLLLRTSVGKYRCSELEAFQPEYEWILSMLALALVSQLESLILQEPNAAASGGEDRVDADEEHSPDRKSAASNETLEDAMNPDENDDLDDDLE